MKGFKEPYCRDGRLEVKGLDSAEGAEANRVSRLY